MKCLRDFSKRKRGLRKLLVSTLLLLAIIRAKPWFLLKTVASRSLIRYLGARVRASLLISWEVGGAVLPNCGRTIEDYCSSCTFRQVRMRTTTKRLKTSTVVSSKIQGNSVVNSIKSENSDVRISKNKRKTAGKIEKHAGEVSLYPTIVQTEPSNDLIKSATKLLAVGSAECVQCFKKFKLQLFPIDNAARERLDANNHNPFLELTLSAQKKISSVVKHLNSKWQIPRTSAEELMLFPYDASTDNISIHRRWTVKDSSVIAADVYMAIGSPSIFRLRYGWFLDLEPKIEGLSAIPSFLEQNLCLEDNQRANVYQSTYPSLGLAEVQGSISVDNSNQVSDPFGASDEYAKESETAKSEKNADTIWAADCFSNISFGALLSQASRGPDVHIPITFDSFDAAIAAHIARCGAAPPSSQTAQPSMLDAEETCMAFPFRKDAPSEGAQPSPQSPTFVGREA